jgi:hypothetical protein
MKLALITSPLGDRVAAEVPEASSSDRSRSGSSLRISGSHRWAELAAPVEQGSDLR